MPRVQPFVVHAHLYQPDRANPWTGVLDPEPSAAPDRDWNARIHRECYRANSLARIYDGRRRVEEIVNNHERLSFDVGPTLLAWLERHAPRTYARLRDADWRSSVRLGHGNAMAQAFHHTILPLSDDRDRRTQIRWGLEDFRHRFDREAEGMWLPETAAHRRTMDDLVDAGVAFTVLSRDQIGEVRRPGGDWEPVAPGGVDGRVAYRHPHSDGSGRSVAVLCYDGDLAHRFAFDPRAMDSDRMVEAIDAAGRGGLTHAALDGETFGHHHRFGELGLAYALHRAAPAAGLEPTNYAAFLADHPPEAEVRVVAGEGTSWSCAHGVDRWWRDCGCATDSAAGWDQAWRAPLREALDLLRDAAAERFADVGDDLLRDPWRARDDYVRVLVGAEGAEAFRRRHGSRALDPDRVPTLWALLESQRHAMAMYTSCGWFFADVGGLETQYVLRFAARVLDLLDEVGAPGPRADLLEALGEARSNRPEVGTAADVWRDRVLPQRVTAERACAHVALQRARGVPADDAESGHVVALSDTRRSEAGDVALVTARAQVVEAATDRVTHHALAGLCLGGLDLLARVADDPGAAAFAGVAEDWHERLASGPLAELLDAVGEALGGRRHGLEAALPEGREGLLADVASHLEARFAEQQARLYHDHYRALEMLRQADQPLRRDVRGAVEAALSLELDARVTELAAGLTGHLDRATLSPVGEVVRRARRQGCQLDLGRLRAVLTGALEEAAGRARDGAVGPATERIATLLALARDVDLELDLRRVQEEAYALAAHARAGRVVGEELEATGRLGELVGLAPVAWGADAGDDARAAG